jgi:hypothetical protein
MSNMLSDKCISVTDLRTNTKMCLDNLQTSEKYIFINNKPVAVIINIKSFEEMKKKSETIPELIELGEDEITPELKEKAEKAKKIKKSNLINI